MLTPDMLHNAKVNEAKKAIVIGSGFGGLAAAIRMQAMGMNVTVLEQRERPGGRAFVYYDEGFTFDAGPTVITAPESIEELFALAGKKLSDYCELMPVDPFYRIMWEDGKVFDYGKDEARLRAEIAKFNPDDVAGYDAFLAYAKEVFAEGYEKLCHVAFLKFWDMIKVSPKLIKLEAYKSVYSKVSSFIKDEHLRQVFSFSSLLIGGNPFRASSIYTLIHPLEKKWGVFFPKGGTHALVRALIKLLEDLGGKLECGVTVDSIVTEFGEVKGVQAQGKLMAADIVVSNADVTNTYKKLLANDSSTRSRSKWFERSRHSMSLYVLYFGTNRMWPNLVHHNVLLCRRYKELLRDIFDRGVLADDFSLYLHAPTLSDPSLAPEGMHSFYVLAPVPNLSKFKGDWDSISKNYGDRIIDYMEKHYMPGLRDSIVVRREFNPNHFVRELSAFQGAAFSLEPTLTQSAYFRVHNADPDVKGLYFVGAGTHPGAGVPGVIGSAKATAGAIFEREFFGKSRVASMPNQTIHANEGI
jgi:phytoene desaturase